MPRIEGYSFYLSPMQCQVVREIHYLDHLPLLRDSTRRDKCNYYPLPRGKLFIPSLSGEDSNFPRVQRNHRHSLIFPLELASYCYSKWTFMVTSRLVNNRLTMAIVIDQEVLDT